MARALWTGSLSFGLVNVPVQLVSAARDLDLHFHRLHGKDKARIEVRRVCSEEDEEVAWEEVARQFAFESGQTVVVTDEELASVQPRKTRTIDIDAFVDQADVDPIYFDHPYVLVPAGDDDGTLRAYRLLVAVMEDQDRVALGRFVMRTKEYLAAVRVRDGALTLETMRFEDEVRPAKDVPTGGKKPSRGQVDRAVQLIEALAVDWDPGAYEDEYRARLEDVIERKRRGGKIEVPEPEDEPSPVPDLMAALKASLDKVKAGESVRVADQDPDLSSLSKDELASRAKDEGIEGRSKMTKAELVEALEDA